MSPRYPAVGGPFNGHLLMLPQGTTTQRMTSDLTQTYEVWGDSVPRSALVGVLRGEYRLDGGALVWHPDPTPPPAA